MKRHAIQVTLLLVGFLVTLSLVVYRAQSAGAPGGRGMMGGSMIADRDEPMTSETWAQMKAMMPVMHDLMDDLTTASDEASAAPIRQQLLAMMTVMRGWMDDPAALPEPETMLAQMEQLWPTMGPMMKAMCQRLSDAEQAPDAQTMAGMMTMMHGMMSGPAQEPDAERMNEMMKGMQRDGGQ